jgi:hypothetical protein
MSHRERDLLQEHRDGRFSFPMLTLYHCTSEAAARQILAVGFRDHMDRYLTDREWTGVWLSDRPMNNTEGASGDTVLQIEIADEILTPYEWVEEGKSYREWIVPAAVLNKDGRVTLAK